MIAITILLNLLEILFLLFAEICFSDDNFICLVFFRFLFIY
jgi:hypothetical protein